MNLAEYVIKEFSISLSLSLTTIFKNNYRQANDDFNPFIFPKNSFHSPYY